VNDSRGMWFEVNFDDVASRAKWIANRIIEKRYTIRDAQVAAQEEIINLSQVLGGPIVTPALSKYIISVGQIGYRLEIADMLKDVIKKCEEQKSALQGVAQQAEQFFR
jgi:hypothetical protein